MTQTRVVEDRVRRMILDTEIGPGERLTERWLEGQLQTSRTSVRAALLRLEGEGLVSRNGRGWIVPPIDVDEVQQLFGYREVLEVAAIRLGGSRASVAELATIQEILDSIDEECSPEELGNAARQFHLKIGSLAKNKFIERGIADCMTQLLRVRWIEIEASAEKLSEHRAVLVALQKGQIDNAVELTKQHISTARARLMDALTAGRRTLRARGIVVS
ncbi:GntR family transcriptional regulator [Burkholderia sp. Bp9142]|uniref:GntR family transcriptional regulator n=1 Tax=Burkholderia sp. Bp9142 TaxID=2184573 RepID=UPI0016243299|nr:GntR family transcriptional regulator [Burkholderia sp. Bp9142]